jgi:hypothetical protein
MAKVFPRRLLRFIALQLRYVADKSKKNHNVERLREKPAQQVKLWQAHLEKLQLVFASFRLKIGPAEVIRRSESILNHLPRNMRQSYGVLIRVRVMNGQEMCGTVIVEELDPKVPISRRSGNFRVVNISFFWAKPMI